MNLIEKLGGYEKASEDFKKLHLNLKEQQKSNKVFMDAFDALKTELLEYRRQHKFYEPNDLVVFVDEKERKPVLLKFKESRNFDLVHLEVIGSGLCGPSYQKEIRHATDAEIKAGKRLEVNQ